MITFRGVSKTYPDGTSAVDGLSLTVEAGSMTVFVGPSGCGKTTAMRMINRMIEPTEGTIEINGSDAASRRPAQLRRGIGYVMQHAGLLPHRTVVDNVATVLRLTGQSRKEARSASYEVLTRVGLDESLAGRYPSQLSGGQQQRVGVARALASDPPILLMDEPFSAVDPLVRQDLQQELLRLQDELKKTIVFVTHDIEEALLLGDRIAVFGPGGVLQQHDSPERVLTAPANDFVSRFAGRERGIRSLAFASASQVRIAPTEPPQGGRVSLRDGWALLVDDAGRPDAWEAPSQERTPVTSTLSEDGSLRSAVDAVLSSPAHTAPVTDSSGALIGTAERDDIFAALASRPGG
ncbi:ABC transporter ATP-binding protein [Nesterenkonia sp. NBAIMH1]|uniref:ABC transporter ATP-binding protein n=1 Tax=Nesterenkonia sp. NBAIMH1 TaxID=2600320 RepID=UPI0011B4B97F|nr:ATP-binding cassette domain-containing protein [Nesterenkonia sp. NBAIMH1]